MIDYTKMPGVNWSSIKHLFVSPKLYRYRTEHQEPETQAFVQGRLLHCAVFEPHRIDGLFAVYDDRRVGKAWDAWQEAHPGVATLKSHEMAPLMEAALEVRRHPVAADLLRGGRVEAPLAWVDEATGIACKGRLDFLRPASVVDLKSTRDVPTERNVSHAATRYLYHGQLAFYHDGAIAAKAIPPDAEPPWLISVQKEPPFDVACDQMNLTDLAAGRALYRELLVKLQACLGADYWPGVAPEARQLVLPDYAPGLYASTEEEVF
jgi:hypothetical protein